MTHIDPFAPADSEQHPSRFQSVKITGAAADLTGTDALPRWIRLDDHPVSMADPDASVIGQQRWEEYRRLLDRYGTDEQRARMYVKTPLTEEHDSDMPTLADLLAKVDEQPPNPTGQKAEMASAEDDLAAKLKAMEEQGL